MVVTVYYILNNSIIVMVPKVRMVKNPHWKIIWLRSLKVLLL